MSKIRLKFRSVSEIVGSKEIGLLILVDEYEQRQLAVTCDKEMLSQFAMRLQRKPIAYQLVPEVLWQVIATQTDLRFEILITDLIEGQYRALLYNVDTMEPIAMRACDAVLLSFIGRIPIYIEERLMMKQSVAYEAESRGISIPVNTISDDMLESALRRAVEDENYELASYLRDEMRRRKRVLNN